MKAYLCITAFVLALLPMSLQARQFTCELPLKKGAITQDISSVTATEIATSPDFQTAAPTTALSISYRNPQGRLTSIIMSSGGTQKNYADIVENFLNEQSPEIYAEIINKYYLRLFMALDADVENQLLVLCHTSLSEAPANKRIEFAGASFMQNIINTRVWAGGWIPYVSQAKLIATDNPDKETTTYDVHLLIDSPALPIRDQQQTVRVTSRQDKILQIKIPHDSLWPLRP